MSSFTEVQKAAATGKRETYNEKLNLFLKQYAVIEPSLRVDLPVEKIQRLDSKIAYIDRYRDKVAGSGWKKGAGGAPDRFKAAV